METKPAKQRQHFYRDYATGQWSKRSLFAWRWLGWPGAIRTRVRSQANELRSSPCSTRGLLIVGRSPPSFGG